MTLPAAPSTPPLLLRFLAAGASAIMLTVANPPADLGWLAWLAPIPFFWALLSGIPLTRSDSKGPLTPSSYPLQEPCKATTAWLGFLHGFLFLMLLAPWFGAFSPAGYPVAGAYWGLLSGVIWTLTLRVTHALTPAFLPPLLAAGWTIWEWLRAQGTLAFPWGTLSVTQHRYVSVLQMLDLTGSYGLTFLMALLAASLTTVLVFRGKDQNHHRAGVVWVKVAFLLGVAAVLRGEWLQRQAPSGAPTVRVAVVQASESVQEGVAVRCISEPEDYASRTRTAIRDGAELVVWPETARMDDVVRSGYARAQLQGLLMGSNAHLLTGSFVVHPESGQSMNAGVLLAPDAEIRGQYAKVLIVPFGEYLPLRPWLRWTEQLGMPATDLRPGDGFKPLEWDRGRIGPSICFESAFGGVSREHVLRGANLLANLTSDGWVGRTAAGYQHAGFAPLRAVETRRSVARAAATGVSALIDPYGRRLTTIPMFEKGYAVRDLPLRTDLTLYARVGDWPVVLAWGLLLLGVGRWVLGVRRGRRLPGAER